LGIVKTWESRWYAGKNYSEYILEDYNIRKFIKKKLYHAGIARIEIERSSNRVRLSIFTSRPGIVIGKKGSEIALLKKELENRGLQSNEVCYIGNDVNETVDDINSPSARQLWILSELRGNGEMQKGEIFPGYQQQFCRSKTTLERDLEELRQRGLMRFEGEKRTGCWRCA